MYTFFVDDHGVAKRKAKQKYFGLGALGIKHDILVDVYNLLVTQKQHLLALYNIKRNAELKGYDLYTHNGVYQKLTVEQRCNIFESFLKAPLNQFQYPELVFIIVIIDKRHIESKAIKEIDILDRTLTMLYERIEMFLSKQKENGYIIFDSGAYKTVRNIIDISMRRQAFGSKYFANFPHIEPSFIPTDSKTCIFIQYSDLAGWAISHYYDLWAKNNFTQKPSENECWHYEIIKPILFWTIKKGKKCYSGAGIKIWPKIKVAPRGGTSQSQGGSFNRSRS